MHARTQRLVLVGLLLAAGVTAGACLSSPGVACGDGWCPDGYLCSAADFVCIKSGCGNAFIEAGEACDDGNGVDGDGCDNNCTATGCGNGVVTAGEACDDGDGVDGDGCDTNCTATGCGNGIVTAGEECDDGGQDDTDGCLATCRLATCGDGAVHLGVEACDDGNGVNGDGCDDNCTVTACGNGVVTTGEACDDGNDDELDDCRNDCVPSGVSWIPVANAAGVMGDTTTDAQADSRNIVGSVAFPAAFWSNTGSELLVRLRLNANPISGSGQLRPFAWGLLFDTDGNPDKYEYALQLDASANPKRIVYAQNSFFSSYGDPSDAAEAVLTVLPVFLGAGGNVDVRPADSCFDLADDPTCAGAADPDQDYFLSFRVSLGIFDLGEPMDLTQWVQLLAGSSSSAAGLSLDLAGCAVSGPNTISLCESAPTLLTCGNHIVEGREGCDDGNTVDGDGCDAQCQLELWTLDRGGGVGVIDAGDAHAGGAAPAMVRPSARR